MRPVLTSNYAADHRPGRRLVSLCTTTIYRNHHNPHSSPWIIQDQFNPSPVKVFSYSLPRIEQNNRSKGLGGEESVL